MAKDLAQIAKQKKIKYFLISFVDLFGVLRAKLVPARAIQGMEAVGVKVAVQVMSSLVARVVIAALGTVTSALAKSATASEKTMVRVAVSPTSRVVSESERVATDGARVATA